MLVTMTIIRQKRLSFRAVLPSRHCVCVYCLLSIRLGVMRYILHLIHVHRFLRYLFPPITGTCPGYSLALSLACKRVHTIPVGLISSPSDADWTMWNAAPRPRPVHAPPATNVGNGARFRSSAGMMTPANAAPMKE